MNVSHHDRSSLSLLFIRTHISMLPVIRLLHLVAQQLNLAKTHRIIPNRMFGSERANDLGAAGRPGCLSCLHRARICMARGPASPVG